MQGGAGLWKDSLVMREKAVKDDGYKQRMENWKFRCRYSFLLRYGSPSLSGPSVHCFLDRTFCLLRGGVNWHKPPEP